MTGQSLIKGSIYWQTLLECPITALHLGETRLTCSRSSPLFCQHVTLVHVLLYFLPKKGGAPRSRVSAVGACKAQRTAGSPAPAVLQPDALPVGLDTEADRCHLKKKPDHMKRDRRSSRTGRRTQRSICLNHRTKPIKLYSSVYDLNYDNIKKKSSLKYRELKVNIIR